MSKVLTLQELFGGFLSDDMIVDGTTNTLVTFKTKAHLTGHVAWLQRELNNWCNELLNVHGVTAADYIKIHKAKKNGEEGSVSVEVGIKGQYNMHPLNEHALNPKTRAFIRKCIAEEILEHHHPKIDFENPLFPQGHVSQYHLWLTANHANSKTRDALHQGPLRDILCILGSHITNFEIFGDRLTVQVYWGVDIDDKERGKVEGVLLAYLEKSGFLSGSRMELVDA